VPRLCEFYPGICLTTEEKARKNLSQGKKEIKQYQEKLLQHVERMDANRIPKQALQYKAKGRRNMG
jgi:hypothetical protein